MTNFESTQAQVHGALLQSNEEVAITLRADVRRRAQELKIKMLNAEQPGATDAMKGTYKQIVARVGQESSGEWGAASAKFPDELIERAISLAAQAESASTPTAAANARMQAAKLRMLAGDEIEGELDWLREIAASARGRTAASPLDFLPDATLLGIQKQLGEQRPVPSHERVAHALKSHRGHEILRDWALVMPEDERTDFLRHTPREHEREIGVRLDEHASHVLHGARIEPNTEDARQRKAVRARVYNELRMAVEDSSPADTRVVAALGRAMLHLGSDTKNLVLDIVRDELDRRDASGASSSRVDYMPHLIGVLLKLIKETDDFRVNDVALQLVGDARTPPGIAASIFRKLIENKYLDASLGTWWHERRGASQGKNQRAGFARGKDVDREHRLEILQALVGELGVVPSREVVEFLDTDSKWPRGSTLRDRAMQIKTSEQEFAGAQTQRELVALLVADKTDTKAMTYYLLHGGEDRFNLINSYSFEKFKEMLGLIHKIKEHPKPVEKFSGALTKGGVAASHARAIIDRLRAGHFYAADRTSARQEINFEVSENAAVKNANAEIGRVLGKNQLGIVLCVPMYREYLAAETSAEAALVREQLAAAQTFEERGRVIDAIDKIFPMWRGRVKKDLEEPWKALGEKLVLGVTVGNVLDEHSVSIRAEELIPRINSKRIDLKRMKKDLIVALKSDNKKITKIIADIERTRRALAEATDERAASYMRRNLQKLEAQRIALGNENISERYAHLSKEERDAEVEKLSKDIIALTEKSPSAIFTYLTMQVIGDRLTEQDTALIEEMHSHLQGPFQTIVDAKTYQAKQSGVPARRREVDMEWLDKRTRFMSMLRFADSKICCFSSCNYEMVVNHDTPNKYWVASINNDPMSFVIALEQPREAETRVHENDGFIFGSFAVDERGGLAVMLNGIYYAPGIEDSRQVTEILGGVERMLAGLPVRTIAIATQYGGAVKMPDDYKQSSVTLTRLRALDSGDGQPETKVYDDLGTGSAMNTSHQYQGLWVKRM